MRLNMEPTVQLCTCLNGVCSNCNGAGYHPCTPDVGHMGQACPFCGGTGQRECEWCHGTGQHTLCGGTGVVAGKTPPYSAPCLTMRTLYQEVTP